ncbi:hypothetical protein [Peptostreptococcus faecalis]|uniref:hypothetical protein n=1 Tax=Peptostreptococcus faecalis TaxID=2045015 RepID=UPI000C7A82C7|nr:hypothetical protein [Peptostreptococcus faecalis]
MNSKKYKAVKVIFMITLFFLILINVSNIVWVLSMMLEIGIKKEVISLLYPDVIILLWTFSIFFLLRMLRKMEQGFFLEKEMKEPKIIANIFLIMTISEAIFFNLTGGVIRMGNMRSNAFSLMIFVYLFIYLVFLILPTLFSEIKNLDEENKSII